MPAKFRLLASHEDKSKNEVALITPWSVMHFMSGAAAKQVGLPLSWFFMIHLAYETKDQVMSEISEQYNSFINSVGDQAIGTLGHVLAPRGSVDTLFSQPFVIAFAAAIFFGWAIEDTAGPYFG